MCGTLFATVVYVNDTAAFLDSTQESFLYRTSRIARLSWGPISYSKEETNILNGCHHTRV